MAINTLLFFCSVKVWKRRRRKHGSTRLLAWICVHCKLTFSVFKCEQKFRESKSWSEQDGEFVFFILKMKRLYSLHCPVCCLFPKAFGELMFPWRPTYFLTTLRTDRCSFRYPAQSRYRGRKRKRNMMKMILRHTRACLSLIRYDSL